MRRTTTARTTARRVAAAALALTVGVTLAACGGASGEAEPTASATATDDASVSQDAEPTAEDVALLEAVEITGDAGAKPTVELPETPFEVTAPVARLVAEGDGDAVEIGDLLSMQTTGISGADGSDLGSTYDGGTPESVELTEATLFATLFEALQGAKIGARVVFAVPQDGGAVVAVADLVGATKVLERAEGEAVAPADGLPTVTLADDGAPSIEAVDGDAPTELVVQPLIEGDGATVEEGQNVIVKYTGWLWDGTQFDSSWESDRTFTVAGVGAAQVIDGWNEGLVGQKVGSQVLLVVPPDKGYGDAEQGTIPANSTLVFVVDVLAAS